MRRLLDELWIVSGEILTHPWDASACLIKEDEPTLSLDRLLQLNFDVMTTGHYPPALVRDAKSRVEELRKRFGTYFNPWFEVISSG
jgi:hypothetical protein